MIEIFSDLEKVTDNFYPNNYTEITNRNAPVL